MKTTKKFFLEHLAIDSETNSHVILLSSEDGGEVLPIWIGRTEAFSIAVALDGKTFPRPLTHDLMIYLLKGLDATINKITISGLKDGTYFALIKLSKENGDIITVDARPSDSIALAIRTDAQIFVDDSVPTVATVGEDSQEYKTLRNRLKKYR